MAKETTIIFVYDTQRLKAEEDDPATAILYFHPSWVSDQQKTALCGQLMGIVLCLKMVLSCPKVIHLQSGKFFIKHYGQYILVVGTDRNITNWVLEYRTDMLCSFINFYHRDIEAMTEIYQTSSSLAAKMYHMFETYLKMIVFGGNIFSYIPTISLPKSASNIFIEAINILQHCQGFDYVLGGLVLYHNKIVATQLSSNITKRFVLTDPYRIKSPAEVAPTDFHLPIGVQLLQVYISENEYYELNSKRVKAKNALLVFKERANKAEKSSCKERPKESVKSMMKRDCSLIFTSVPEEDNDSEPNFSKNCNNILPMKPLIRPKFLNLKYKITDMQTTAENIKQVNTPFSNHGSVISTPMTDLNKVLHINTISICIDPNENENVKKFNQLVSKIKENHIEGRVFGQKSQSLISLYQESIYLHKDTRNRRNSIGDPTFFNTENEKNFEKSYCKNYGRSKYSNGSIIKNELKVAKNSDINNLPNNSSVVLRTKLENVPSKLEKDKKRKSLNLPLKSLSIDSDEQNTTPSCTTLSSGVMLTPLMQKLSNLAIEEHSSSGFGSYNMTPIECKEFLPGSFKYFNRNRIETEPRVVEEEVNGSLRKCVMFVCGQQDTVVGILLEEYACNSEELIKKLWEVCTINLGELENRLHHCMEPYTANVLNEREPYSFLCLDNQWDTVKRGGPWGNHETVALTYLHSDFQEKTNLTEILWRDNDSIIYGYRCGDNEVFYHQLEGINSGLPTPSDPMGLIPVKAKRILERDHGVILF